MKKNLLLVSLLFLAASAMAQNETIVVTTAKAVGETLRFMLGAAEADKPDVWIDLNNNTVKDEGEAVVTFAPRTYYTIGAQTVTIHGKVTALYCNTTGITGLDVSNNALLKELNCGNNVLTELDLTNCPLLTYVALYSCQLPELDLSENTFVRTLDCSGCQLTELDLSSCDSLTSIACYSNDINGENMTALMNSLPTPLVTSNLTIFAPAAATTDLNAATAADVAIATGKNWNVINVGGSSYVVTGINEIANSDFNILSKNGQLNINLVKAGELVSIFNIAGQQVFKGQIESTSVNVPLNKGIYLVRVNSKVCKAVVE